MGDNEGQGGQGEAPPAHPRGQDLGLHEATLLRGVLDSVFHKVKRSIRFLKLGTKDEVALSLINFSIIFFFTFMSLKRKPHGVQECRQYLIYLLTNR